MRLSSSLFSMIGMRFYETRVVFLAALEMTSRLMREVKQVEPKAVGMKVFI